MCAALILVAIGCGKESPSSSKSESKVGENPLNAPAEYGGALVKAQQKALKTVGGASLDSAIKLFFDQEGRYPKSLNELVSSGTLPKLPTPPNGMKFDYDPATGKVTTSSK